jgi:Uma2 family endonuclease
MATTAPPLPAAGLIPIDEYLRTTYRPDCDFVDGEIVKRNLGEYEHGRLQIVIGAWFLAREEQWNIRVVTELRTRVAASRVRIPDLSILRAEAPREPVTRTPPLLCIEVLSPEDRLPRVAKRMDDFLTMGVENIWIIDPMDRVAYTYSANGLLKLTSDRLEILNTPICLDLPTLFAAWD